MENQNIINEEKGNDANRVLAAGLVVCWMCKGSGNIDEHEQEYCTIRHVTIERDDIPFICDDYQPCS